MKKRIVKKYHVRESVKDTLMTIALISIVVVGMFIWNIRIESIENNKDAYNESGHAYSIEVNFMR